MRYALFGGLLSALLCVATGHAQTSSAPASSTPPAPPIKCTAPAVATQTTTNGKTQWVCAQPPGGSRGRGGFPTAS
jgi:hypothetical protein